MNSGIYRIVNIITGKFYIGRAKNFNKRKYTHFHQLRNKKHHCVYLQRSFDKYGEDSFIFESIEECEVKFLKQKEQEYLDNITDWKLVYNISKKSSGGDLLSYHPNRSAIVEKITKTIKYKFSTGEMRGTSLPMEKNPNWKGGASFKYCKCGKRINTTANFCIKCHNKSGENNAFYGKTHSEETKQKLKDIFTGRPYVGNQETPVIINNVEYKSLAQASRELNIHLTTIRHRVNSKNIKFVNYYYQKQTTENEKLS